MSMLARRRGFIFLRNGIDVSLHLPGLTEQELILARTARFDLGSGYPQIGAPAFVRRLFRDNSLEDVGLMTPPAWNIDKQTLIDSNLVGVVRRTLGEVAADCQIRSTFSGSVALERSITACLRRSRELGFKRLEVVTTSPSIDIIPDFLAERADIVTTFAECMAGEDFPLLDLNHLASLICAPLRSGFTRALLLTSPENPTGAIWNRDDLLAIASLCNRLGYSVIVDHCFYLAGVHKQPPPAIWELGSIVEFWIGVWDTGKTFGLNGEKLGFILSSPAMVRYVDDALRVLQFDVSRRQKLFFTELLTVAPYFDYVENLRSICSANLDTLARFAERHGLSCRVPIAGSLALVSIQELGLVDTAIQERLLQSGVGVVTGSAFFHGEIQRHDLIRIALARDSPIFTQALEIIDSVLVDARP